MPPDGNRMVASIRRWLHPSTIRLRVDVLVHCKTQRAHTQVPVTFEILRALHRGASLQEKAMLTRQRY